MSKRQTLSFKCLIHPYCIIKVICTKSGGCLRDEYLTAVSDLGSSMTYTFDTALITPMNLLWTVKNFKVYKNGNVS